MRVIFILIRGLWSFVLVGVILIISVFSNIPFTYAFQMKSTTRTEKKISEKLIERISTNKFFKKTQVEDILYWVYENSGVAFGFKSENCKILMKKKITITATKGMLFRDFIKQVLNEIGSIYEVQEPDFLIINPINNAKMK